MKSTIISIVIAVILIGGAIFLSNRNPQPKTDINTENATSTNNVTMENGKQIISITARGGYSPRTSTAKAGIPTVLRFVTNGAFDCSSSIRIPSMGIGKNLSQSGSTDIDLGSPKVGTLPGTCGMGMYSFSVDFQ